MATSKRKKNEASLRSEGAERPAPKPKAEAGAAVSLAKPGTAKAEPPGVPLSTNRGVDMAEYFRSQKPAAEMPAACPHCKLDGKLGDFTELQLGPAGGWNWVCPRCKGVVYTFVFVV